MIGGIHLKTNKIKYLFIIFFIILSKIILADSLDNKHHYPCLILHNGNNISFISDDPNWDDQKLIVNGKVMHALHKQLMPKENIQICGKYYEFGIIFEDNNQQYLASATVSNNKLELTNITIFPENKIKYNTIQQDTELIEMELVND